jgi:hypothetical protein
LSTLEFEKYQEISNRIWAGEPIPGEPVYEIPKECEEEEGPIRIYYSTEPAPKALQRPAKCLPRSGSNVQFTKPQIVVDLEKKKKEENRGSNEWQAVEVVY